MSAKLWPLLNEYQLTDDLLNQQRELVDRNQVTLATPSTEISEFLSNTEITAQLKWAQLKVLRLIQINQAIHMQIQHITKELNRTIK